MKEKKSVPGIIGIITLFISILGIFSTIINDKIINNKSISIIIDSELALVNDKELLNDVEIYYKGNKIQNLYKANFIITNDGNTSFTKNDIIENISIKLPLTLSVIYIDKTRSIPESLNIGISFVNNNLDLNFSLLNKDDYYEFSVYYTGEKIQNFSVEGRIKDLKEIKHIDRRISEIKKEKKKANWLSWTLGIICSLFLLVLLPNIKKVIIHKKVRKELLQKGLNYIIEKYNLKSRANIIQFIYDQMGYLTDKQKKELTGDLQNNDFNCILSKIDMLLPIKGSVEASFTFYIIVVSIGIIYFIWFFFI